MREGKLYRFKECIKSFFSEFKDDDIKNLSEEKIQKRLIHHKLSVEEIKKEFSENYSN